jgi:type II secretory pathway component PulL
MAKKSRRAKAKQRARVAQVAQEAQATQEGRSQQLKPMPTKLQSPTRVSPKAQDLTSRYQYVLPEIKRIGIIAGAIILVLIILSFVLG